MTEKKEKKDKKVMVIEDDKAIASMYVDRLEAEGYSVTHIEDGEKGVEAIIVEEPDFVLLDIMLPKKNGLEILEIVRSNPKTKNTPIIVLTAFPSHQYADKVNEFGASGFFNKAVTLPKEITYLVNRILSSQE